MKLPKNHHVFFFSEETAGRNYKFDVLLAATDTEFHRFMFGADLAADRNGQCALAQHPYIQIADLRTELGSPNSKRVGRNEVDETGGAESYARLDKVRNLTTSVDDVDTIPGRSAVVLLLIVEEVVVVEVQVVVIEVVVVEVECVIFQTHGPI